MCVHVCVCGPCADHCRTQLGQSPVSQRGYNEILNRAESEVRSDLGQQFELTLTFMSVHGGG